MNQTKTNSKIQIHEVSKLRNDGEIFQAKALAKEIFSEADEDVTSYRFWHQLGMEFYNLHEAKFAFECQLIVHEKIVETDFNKVDYIRLLCDLADASVLASNYVYAIRIYEQALGILIIEQPSTYQSIVDEVNEKLLITKQLKSNTRKINRLVNAARKLRYQEKYNEAIIAAIKALENATDRLKDSEIPDFIWNLLGLEFYHYKMYSESLVAYQNAVSYAKKYYNCTNILAANMGDLAMVYEAMGKLKEALALHEQAYDIRKNNSGENDMITLMSKETITKLKERIKQH